MLMGSGSVQQDLRKGNLNGWVLELLNQVVRQHPMRNLRNRSAGLSSDHFEAAPN
jgi:hypothetical protein